MELPDDSTAVLATVLVAIEQNNRDLAVFAFCDLIDRIDAGFPPRVEEACRRIWNAYQEE